ncbi:PQQ-binding-like beta-propeller repeat protein [Conexibacter sp. DBS9H8]|uniref:outer membrane protein assembly factor BamB family protein n=1 Tax=Conexibacter sp. DBS9H8 TaxID=2937801 RepID=UPI00200DBCC8|nr:PQQ-binding-like beta-propeller repeat protein [Conexibacter sp. DBS9H8]
MPDDDERPSGRRLNGRLARRLMAGAGAAVLLVVAAVVFVLVHAPHNVSHPNLSFTAPTTSTTTTAAPPPPDHFLWPRYGYDLARTRAFTGAPDLHPPFRRGWTVGQNALLEFPPVIDGHTLWYMDDNATVKAVDTITGRVRWQRRIGRLAAASPVLDPAKGLLIVPTLSDTGSSPGSGQVIALSMRTGATIWHHFLPSGSESSGLIAGGSVYFGDQAGTVYSMNAATGHVNWTFQASGAVKGGAALSGENLYVDDYGGHVYDINARTGHQIWAASANGAALGFSSGTFYTTPAVAFGRVYVGNTSGYVYSFTANTGQLAWSYGTGAYVYSSPAVADIPGLGPTVYLGSYNGDFYAFNARSGAVRWVHRDAYGDRISGSPTIVNDVVYYSDLDDKLTTGLNARSGKVVFTFHDGAFSPVVADPTHLYLVGGYTLYQLLPASTRRTSRPPAAPPRSRTGHSAPRQSRSGPSVVRRSRPVSRKARTGRGRSH